MFQSACLCLRASQLCCLFSNSSHSKRRIIASAAARTLKSPSLMRARHAIATRLSRLEASICKADIAATLTCNNKTQRPTSHVCLFQSPKAQHTCVQAIRKCYVMVSKRSTFQYGSCIISIIVLTKLHSQTTPKSSSLVQEHVVDSCRMQIIAISRAYLCMQCSLRQSLYGFIHLCQGLLV